MTTPDTQEARRKAMEEVVLKLSQPSHRYGEPTVSFHGRKLEISLITTGEISPELRDKIKGL